MKRPFLHFLGLVVLPAALTMWAADRAAESAHLGIRMESATRVARLAIGTLEQDLGAAVDVLVESAQAFQNPDTAQEATRRALAGDTVTALDPTASGMDLLVLFADPEDPETLYFNQGILEPAAATLVGRVTRARIGIYAEGRLWVATDPPPAAAEVDAEALAAAAASDEAVRVGQGVLIAMDPPRGAITALVEPVGGNESALSLPIRLVMALLLFFAALAGWILLTGHRERTGSGSRAATVLLALVPAVATVALLIHVVRDFDETADAFLARDLTRTLAVVNALDLADSPVHVRRMSGFHAAHLEGGRVRASTMEGVGPELEALPSPPPSFTTSGLVTTPLGRSHYVGRRLGPRSAIVLLAPLPEAARASLSARAWALGVALWAWLILVGLAMEVRARRSETVS